MKKLFQNTWFILIFSALVLIIFFAFFRLMKRKEAETAKVNNNVQAFLKVISYAEGTDSPNGYNYLFGSRYDNEILFNGYGGHPNIHKPFQDTTSTAAGRYQIRYATWMWMGKGILGLPDFSPESQDLCAIGLINYRGGLEHLLAGRFEQAVYMCRQEWASFPGANYPGQGMRSIESLKQVYLNAGGQLA